MFLTSPAGRVRLANTLGGLRLLLATATSGACCLLLATRARIPGRMGVLTLLPSASCRWASILGENCCRWCAVASKALYVCVAGKFQIETACYEVNSAGKHFIRCVVVWGLGFE